MSHTVKRRPWRQQRLFRQGRQLLLKPLTLPSTESIDHGCCGESCGEEDEFADLRRLLWAAKCPTPDHIVAAFYGSSVGELARGNPEPWVHEHIKYCANCNREMELLILMDEATYVFHVKQVIS